MIWIDGRVIWIDHREFQRVEMNADWNVDFCPQESSPILNSNWKVLNGWA